MLFPTSERRSHHNCPLVNFLTTFRIAHNSTVTAETLQANAQMIRVAWRFERRDTIFAMSSSVQLPRIPVFASSFSSASIVRSPER